MKSKSDPFDLFSCAGLDRDNIRQLALETGFCKRASGRISAPDFLIHLCLQSVAGTVSYNDLAARVEAHTGVAASRQAYWERTDEPCVRFFQGILERIMLSKCRPDDIQAVNRQRPSRDPGNSCPGRGLGSARSRLLQDPGYRGTQAGRGRFDQQVQALHRPLRSGYGPKD